MYSSTVVSSQDDTLIIRFLYVGHVDNPNVKLSSEHDALEWLPVDEFARQMSTTSWGEGVLCAMRHGFLRSLSSGNATTIALA